MDKNIIINQEDKFNKKSNFQCNESNLNYDNLLENFVTSDAEIKQIDKKIDQSDMVCSIPINKYILLVSLLIIVLLIFMILEHMNKK